MVSDGHASLDPLLRVRERFLERGAGHTAERRTHARVGACEDGVEAAAHDAGLSEHVVARDAYVVEEDLALVERALAQLVQRLASADAGEVERDDGHAGPRHASGRVDGQERQGVCGDGAVGDPGRLLAVDHPVVAISPSGAFKVDVGPGVFASEEDGV